MYDFIQANAPVRSLVIIGTYKKVKLIITYPASAARNFVEVLYELYSLQLTANYNVVAPVNC